MAHAGFDKRWLEFAECKNIFPADILLPAHCFLPLTPMAWKNSTAGFFLSPSAANRMIIPLRPLLWWFAFANCDSLEKPPSGSILSAPSHQQPVSADHLYNVAGIFLQSHCSTRLFFLHDGIVSKKTFIINRYKAEKRC
jgi:hypothetical protein